jgi:hypothetical protein
MPKLLISCGPPQDRPVVKIGVATPHTSDNDMLPKLAAHCLVEDRSLSASRTTSAEIDVTGKSGLPLTDILREASERCLPEEKRLPPPGYELALWSGVSVYGADSVLFVGTLGKGAAMQKAIFGSASTSASAASTGEAVVAPSSPEGPSTAGGEGGLATEAEPVFNQIFQPKGHGPVADRSILQKGSCLIAGSDIGQLVFARRSCLCAGEPQAIIFPDSAML